MAHPSRLSNINNPTILNPRPDLVPTHPVPAPEIPSPFDKLDGLDRDDFCEAAYEVFFTACRSSPGFGGRGTITHINISEDENGETESGLGSSIKPFGVGMAVTSRVKNALGLKMVKWTSSSRRTSSLGEISDSPIESVSNPRLAFTVPPPGKRRPRRTMTSGEIMRQQMRVTKQSDNRLRRTLMKTFVGQISRRTETIILPLELLRHLKPSEFHDAQEYHLWQKRQLKVLEAGLLNHPYIPLKKPDTCVTKLREIIHASETKPIDTGKNSETMKTLLNCVSSLAWRCLDGESTEMPHWADVYPLNVQIYTALLFSVFDLKDETLVLDEVDELLELMRKTWSVLGINRSIHNICFTWVFFEQYIVTGQVEPGLLSASLAMLNEVANDAKKVDRDPAYLKILTCVLSAMKIWCEKRLLDYHDSYDKGTIGLMENILPLVYSVKKILEEDVRSYVSDDSSGNKFDCYIRSSVRNAFAKMFEGQNVNASEAREESEVLMQLARETEELASKEKDTFSHVFKKWQPNAAGVATLTLHTCYGTLLKKYLRRKSSPGINGAVLLLLRAGKLEKALVQMVVEESAENKGDKALLKEMVSYEVDSSIDRLLKQWIQERLFKAKGYLQFIKEIETWNPKSKGEPHAQSAVELIRIAREAVDDFLEIRVNVSENLVYDLADGLEHLFRDYVTFVAFCASKQNYTPSLPPLTRFSRDSKFRKLYKKALCSIGVEDQNRNTTNNQNNPRPSTSHGTQRLFVRLNTLHYLLSHLNALNKTFSLSLNATQSPKPRFGNKRQLNSSYFELSRSAIQAACQHVSEIAAHRLIFLDSNPIFYDGLYVGSVTKAQIGPVLRILKQNLNLLCTVLTMQAQPLALKEVMKASFQAYLTVLLAGGNSRVFYESDHSMIEEDFENLKRVFCMCSEGLIGKDVVEKEAKTVKGVVGLMGQSTEQLIEDFSIVACKASGNGVVGSGQRLLIPPMTGKWNRSDPNTILRVLCYRNDHVANKFLKRSFQLPKRRGAC